MSNLFKTSTTPLLIAGPCSIESPEMLRQVALALASMKVDWIRGGVWKPRTRPGGFEGHGEEALRWMMDIKKEMPQLRFCCEVARPEHVELCLRYGVDALWLGSRTVGNPFSVGELCASLQGTHIPVLVKNPMTPDVALWQGAIERIERSGIESIAAIHRGFSMFNNLGYRNHPLWEIPMELRRRMPDLPLLCDPSHIGGKDNLVGELMQTALDLHFDGLMVEVHPSPSCALTDSAQQITPELFLSLVANLKVHQDNNPSELQLLRQQIDSIDSQLLDLLANRLKVSRTIAEVKAENNMAVYQPKRWTEVLQRKLRQAEEMGLDPDFVKELYERIHTESVKVQLQK